ncbi:MAG: site-specific integrase [Lachnospiraceae bacterium]|nr:site-specific integrase [Lachnospiraceae bacterium]
MNFPIHYLAKLSADCITDLFARLKKDSGISRLHAHLLRHTFATSYLVGGGNLEFLRVFLGHSDYNVTRGYSQLTASLFCTETGRFYFVSSGLDGGESKKDKAHCPIFLVFMRHRGLEPRTT